VPSRTTTRPPARVTWASAGRARASRNSYREDRRQPKWNRFRHRGLLPNDRWQSGRWQGTLLVPSLGAAPPLGPSPGAGNWQRYVSSPRTPRHLGSFRTGGRRLRCLATFGHPPQSQRPVPPSPGISLPLGSLALTGLSWVCHRGAAGNGPSVGGAGLWLSRRARAIAPWFDPNAALRLLPRTER
jgi:hypothetical protein